VIGEVASAVQALGIEIKELLLLSEVDAPLPAALAEALLIPRPSITVYVKRLEAAQLLKRD
jgi:DNA-binding MarR family transcriptional regulator